MSALSARACRLDGSQRRRLPGPRAAPRDEYHHCDPALFGRASRIWRASAIRPATEEETSTEATTARPETKGPESAPPGDLADPGAVARVLVEPRPRRERGGAVLRLRAESLSLDPARYKVPPALGPGLVWPAAPRRAAPRGHSCDRPVGQIAPAGPFYFAEGYHQQYLAKNPGGYCGLGGTGVSCPIGVGVAAE